MLARIYLERKTEKMKSNIISVIFVLFLIFNGRHLLPYHYSFRRDLVYINNYFVFQSNFTYLVFSLYLKFVFEVFVCIIEGEKMVIVSAQGCSTVLPLSDATPCVDSQCYFLCSLNYHLLPGKSATCAGPHSCLCVHKC